MFGCLLVFCWLFLIGWLVGWLVGWFVCLFLVFGICVCLFLLIVFNWLVGCFLVGDCEQFIIKQCWIYRIWLGELTNK